MPNVDNWESVALRNMTRFEQRTHRELLAEAKRPVDSLTPDYIEALVVKMQEQQRWTWPRTERHG